MKISGKYYADTKQSIVTVQNKQGIYTGIAKLHPNDTPNEIIGCNIAENRAIRKMFKAKIFTEKTKIKALKSFRTEIINYIKQIKDTIPFDTITSDIIIQRLDYAIKSYNCDIEEMKKSIILLQEAEKNQKRIREKIRSKINKISK